MNLKDYWLQRKNHGKVKIVTTAKELNKVGKGDIMVSNDKPDYIPNGKSFSLITDEGG